MESFVTDSVKLHSVIIWVIDRTCNFEIQIRKAYVGYKNEGGREHR